MATAARTIPIPMCTPRTNTTVISTHSPSQATKVITKSIIYSELRKRIGSHGRSSIRIMLWLARERGKRNQASGSGRDQSGKRTIGDVTASISFFFFSFLSSFLLHILYFVFVRCMHCFHLFFHFAFAISINHPFHSP